VGDAWGWKRTGEHQIDEYKQFPLNEVITSYRRGKPFADAKTAIAEARRDMIAGMKMAPHTTYYPEKHGLAVMPADLVAVGYAFDEEASGKHGYAWRFGDEVGPNVAYGGAAIEGARLHYAATLALQPPAAIDDAASTAAVVVAGDPVDDRLINIIVPEWVDHVLTHYDPINADFQTALGMATVEQLEAALFRIPPSTTPAIKRRRQAVMDRLDAILPTDPPPPDPRLVRAKEVRDLLDSALQAARTYYGELTGLHSQVTALRRQVAPMIERLDTLIDTLTRKEPAP
jgi:hypothetical protein